MAEIHVAIIGLERLGVSLGLALKRYMRSKDSRHTFTVTGHDERDANAKTARERGAVDATARTPLAAVKEAPIVLLTGPYHQAEELYQTIGPSLRPGAVVLDFSPLKTPSIRWAADHLPQDREVAAYMVGLTAVLNPAALFDPDPGADGARADLFDDGTMILAEAVELAAEFSRLVGADVHFMDPDEHDGLIAATEGLPALLGVGLFRALSTAEAWGDLRRLTNPAFGLATHHLRDQHPDSLWALLHYNRHNTARYLAALIQALDALRESLETDAEGLGVEAALTEGAARYQEWEGQRLANRWEKAEGPALPTGGMLSAMSGMLFGQRPPKDEDERKK